MALAQPGSFTLILATHGRGVYIVDDITPIRQITPEVLQSKLTVLENRPSPVRLAAGDQSFPGDDEFIGRNTPEVAFITYYMKERHTFGDFKIQVFDSSNQLITTLPAGTRRGINRVEWPMRLKPPKVPPAANIEFGSLSGPMVPEGTYTAKLVRGDESYTATIQLVGDPALPHSAAGRKLQQTTVMNLYRLIERLAFVDAQIVDARDQAEKRKLGAARAKFEELHKTLAATREGQITGEEKIREQLGELYGDVSRYGGRPTQSQIDRAKVLEAEVDAASKSFDAEMSKLPELKKLSKEEYDRRQKDR